MGKEQWLVNRDESKVLDLMYEVERLEKEVRLMVKRSDSQERELHKCYETITTLREELEDERKR